MAPFFICLVFLCSVAQASDSPSTLCLADRQPEAAYVERVTDGDTLVLKNGQRVRLIGINTLELNAQSATSRASARAATDALRQLIGNRRVSLLAGPESHDQHGRRLAHVLNEDGIDVASEMIRVGHATAIAVAENTLCANHHFALEQTARDKELGIWNEPTEWYVDQNKLGRGSRGFKLMTTTLTSVRSEKNRHVLGFSNGVQATLGKHWPVAPPDRNLIGTRVEIRGWVGGKNNKPKLTLHHPLNMRILSD